MFEQTFKNIDNALRRDDGCGSELDYVEQSSWILFLKYLDDLEETRQMKEELNGKTYTRIIAENFRWSTWAAPKDADGNPDHHNAMTGDDLMSFVHDELFPYLKSFKDQAESAQTIQYKIGEIFGEIHCKIDSGYVLRDVLWAVDSLKFQTSAEKHEMSHLYESRINKMGNAGRNGGEYYTPRPLIRSIVRMVNPELGKTVYDGACGSAGFLCEAFTFLLAKAGEDFRAREALQHGVFFGKEKKVLPYIIGTMNMILHGVEAPNILHTNTLKENLADVQESDKYHYILANPPFGGLERDEVKQNFFLKSGETAYLFLQHFIKHLKAGGKAGIVIKNTFLSNGDAIALRRELLEDCNLYAVLDLPQKVFSAGVKTVVLFFEKGVPTEKIWYYQLNLDRNLGKTNPLNENDLADFEKLFADKADSPNSWSVDVNSLDPQTLDLSVKNPNQKEAPPVRTPAEIIADMKSLEQENLTLLAEIEALVQK
jgi:type I restriction enzyme M protein